MAIDSPAGDSATPPSQRRRLVALAVDALLVTLAALIAFAVFAAVVDPQLVSEDPAHENDPLAFFLVPPAMAVGIAGIVWLTSRDGRTPGGRLTGCRLAARPPMADLATVTRRYWIALASLPSLVFCILSFVGPAAFAGPLAVGLASLVVTASVAAYGWPTDDHRSTWIEDLIGGSFQRQAPATG